MDRPRAAAGWGADVTGSSGASGIGVADLRRRARASVQTVSSLRRELTDWAARAGLSREIVEAVVLAGYEALANAVEHAYPDQHDEAVALHATRAGRLVTVTVTDWGRWREPPADPGHRGRGLILIHKLCSRAEITATGAGTTVVMTWRLDEFAGPGSPPMP
jgi:serine/threonine-protein kinase RsbW